MIRSGPIRMGLLHNGFVCRVHFSRASRYRCAVGHAESGTRMPEYPDLGHARTSLHVVTTLGYDTRVPESGAGDAGRL